MLTIGDSFPSFTAKAVIGLERGKEFTILSSDSFPGKWKIYFFWPKDFTFVCPTEIAAFGKLERELTPALGVLDRREGVALRATFIVDPEGVIRFASVNDLSVGRNPDEVLRVLDALQTDELCPCNWKKGDATL